MAGLGWSWEDPTRGRSLDNYPMAPLVLGIVLGDLLEKNLRRGLVLSDGDLAPFVTRPISAVLFATIVLVVLFRFEWMRSLSRRLFSRGEIAELATLGIGQQAVEDGQQRTAVEVGFRHARQQRTHVLHAAGRQGGAVGLQRGWVRRVCTRETGRQHNGRSTAATAASSCCASRA